MDLPEKVTGFIEQCRCLTSVLTGSMDRKAIAASYGAYALGMLSGAALKNSCVFRSDLLDLAFNACSMDDVEAISKRIDAEAVCVEKV